MAVNSGYKQFPEFDVRKDPDVRFVKYAERFKNNHLKAYNITDKARQRSLFLDSIGEATLEIFEISLLIMERIWIEPSMRYETSARNRRTGCSIYTSFVASNKERTKPGIRSSPS